MKTIEIKLWFWLLTLAAIPVAWEIGERGLIGLVNQLNGVATFLLVPAVVDYIEAKRKKKNENNPT